MLSYTTKLSFAVGGRGKVLFFFKNLVVSIFMVLIRKSAATICCSSCLSTPA